MAESLHFGAFAPWMRVATKATLQNVRWGDSIAIIYIPVQPLRGMSWSRGKWDIYGLYAIPFYKSIWIGKSRGGK